MNREENNGGVREQGKRGARCRGGDSGGSLVMAGDDPFTAGEALPRAAMIPLGATMGHMPDLAHVSPTGQSRRFS